MASRRAWRECWEETGRREEEVVVKKRERLLWGWSKHPVGLQKELLMWNNLVLM